MNKKDSQKVYRHSFDGHHFFYYHQLCVERNSPGVLFEEIRLASVAQHVLCDFCYEPLHGKSEYQKRQQGRIVARKRTTHKQEAHEAKRQWPMRQDPPKSSMHTSRAPHIKKPVIY